MSSTKVNNKIRSGDRIIELRPMDGKKPISSIGLIDTRLFTGENKLHAVMDPQSCLWHLKYEEGGLPGPLKQQFTAFSKLFGFVQTYFAKRNVEITEVID